LKYNKVPVVNRLNKKILLAPLLAIALVLFLAAAINSLHLPKDAAQINPSPQPTSSLTTLLPQTGLATAESPIFFFVLAVAGAIMIGIVVVLLFFREKNLTKELNE
jgi:hypothetical protein